MEKTERTHRTMENRNMEKVTEVRVQKVIEDRNMDRVMEKTTTVHRMMEKKTKRVMEENYGGESAESKEGEDKDTAESDEEEDKDCPESDGENASTDGEEEESEYRQCNAGPEMFKIKITRKQWNNIKPKHGDMKLSPPWTDVLYNEFRKTNPCCTLVFKYQHVKASGSRKKNAPYFRDTAKCSFNDCKAMYSILRRSSLTPKTISFNVVQFGVVTHQKKES